MTVTLDERVTYLLIGIAIGFMLGYFTAYLKKIRKSVEHVEQIVMKDHKEEGSVRLPSYHLPPSLLEFKRKHFRWRSVALFLVVAMTVWAAIASQVASNESKRNAESISKVTFCNQQIISKLVVALNERVESGRAQTNANVNLQKGFLDFLRVLQFDPPKPEAERREAFDGYVKKLDNFVEKADESKAKGDQFPYPTFNELSECLDKPLSEIKKEPQYDR